MNDREIQYLRLPITIQNLVCSFEGWRIQKRRFGNNFKNILKKVESRAFLSTDEILQYRDKRLLEFIHHCYSTVSFYRRRFNEMGLKPEDFKCIDDLQQLPILTKKEVQDNYPNLVSNVIPRKLQVLTHTSGTTGGGLRFATTLRAIQEQWAVWWRYRRWHRLQLGTWCGYFGGRSVVPLSQTGPPFWRYNILGKQILFSGYHMSPKNLDHYVYELQRRQPPWLHGYPSLLSLLAGHILEKKLDIGYQIQWITVGAENLLQQQASLIQKAFGIPPKQHYGMAEAVANFSECEYGALHVDEDFAAVEFIYDPSISGYRVLGTNLSNPVTPLLRYDIQDVVFLTDEICPCGRPGRVVKSIDGRAEDYVILKNGVRIGRMDHIFKDLTNVREAQIIQQYPGKITIKIVRGDNYSEHDEVSLLGEVHKRVGEECIVIIEYVQEIARSKTGKLRFVVSDLKEGKLV